MKNVKYPEFSSFLISLFLAFLILCFVGYRLGISSLQAIKYTDDKDAVIDIYFEEDSEENSKPEKSIEEKTVEKQTETPKPEPKKTEIPKEQPKEVIKEEPKNELVKEPKETLEAKAEPTIEHNQTQSELEQTDELVLSDLFDSSVKKSVENSKDHISDSQSLSNSNKGKSQRTGVYNEFIGGVEKKLERIWRSYRANPGYSAVVEIRITKDGRAYVDIVKIPYDTMFNQKVRDFADRIEKETFPRPPGNEFIQEYKLTDKLKEN
ncbi:MAG: TonB C-terminal domain-containing protein [Campylobacter sp.]|nr:TonB C-terminal domain-containing protein [Campylobacter sp.]